MMKQKQALVAGILAALVLGTGLPVSQAAQNDNGTQMLYTAPEGKPLVEEDSTEKQEEQLKISINLAARSLALFRGTERVALYPIGPGTPSTPTPTGYYKIQEKEVNPTWVSPEDPKIVIPSGPDCPIGYRWMTLQGHYGIHGTNKPSSIGEYVSNGCVRMLEEDVEELFDKVSVGTPVEITYNRIVVEKADDAQIVYYIYPDGYGCQPIDVADVRAWLKGYGVQDFVTDTALEEKIAAADGEPTYIAKVYPLFVNGQKLEGKAVEQNGIVYLPAVQLAEATKINLGWNASVERLISSEGSARGYDKQDTLYCDPQAARTLFHLQGGLAQDGTYTLRSVGLPAPTVQPIEVPANPTDKPEVTTAQDIKQAKDAKQVKQSKDKKSKKTQQAKRPKTLAEIEAEATKQ